MLITPKRSLLLLALLLAAPLTKGAEESAQSTLAAPPAPPAKPAGDDEVRIKEIFTTHLPVTMKAYGFRLWVHPHLGDFDSKDWLRISTGARYGLTNRWEISAASDTYFSHGFGDVGFMQRGGFANLQFGSKWNIGDCLLQGWDSAIGIDMTTPVDHPPADLTDGMRHVAPYLTFSRRLSCDPRLRVFWGLGADFIHHTDIIGEGRKNDLRDSANSVTVGAVFDRKRLHYSLETILASTRLLGQTERDSLTLRPGIVWEIPPRKGHAGRGQWMVGASLYLTEGPDGFSMGASLKLRANLDLKKLFHRSPSETH
jgi:hypothetical protein